MRLTYDPSHQCVECEAIASGGGDAHKHTVPVNRLSTPGPRIHLWIVVFQLKLHIQSLYTFLLLLLQSFPTNKINVLLQNTGTFSSSVKPLLNKPTGRHQTVI